MKQRAISADIRKQGNGYSSARYMVQNGGNLKTEAELLKNMENYAANNQILFSSGSNQIAENQENDPNAQQFSGSRKSP